MKLATVEELVAGQLERFLEPDFIAQVNANDLAERAKHKKYQSKSRRKYERYNSAKVSVRHSLMWAIKTGKIKRGTCVYESSGLCDGPVQAHHYLGYDWIHRFDVRWLCIRHHAIVEKDPVSTVPVAASNE